MLHVSPQSGQARRTSRWAGWIASSLILCVLAAPVAHAQHTAPTLAQAEALARDGQHLAAAARYEQLARRGFMNWDATTALLAAREYVIGGAVDDAQRLLDKARRSRQGATTSAHCWPRSKRESRSHVAMRPAHSACCGRCRNPGRPSPLPTCSRCVGVPKSRRAMPSRGVRTFEERAALLASPAARAANDRLLFDQLLQRPPGAVTTAGVSERERGWLELPAIVTAGGNDAGHTATATAWMTQHPGHPGTSFLPNAVPAQPGFVTIGGWALDEHRLAVATFGQAAVGWRCGPRWLCSGLVRFVVRRHATARRVVRHGRARRRRGVSARDRRRCPDGRRTADQGRNRGRGCLAAGRAAGPDTCAEFRRDATRNGRARFSLPVRARSGAGSTRRRATDRGRWLVARRRAVSQTTPGDSACTTPSCRNCRRPAPSR